MNYNGLIDAHLARLLIHGNFDGVAGIAGGGAGIGLDVCHFPDDPSLGLREASREVAKRNALCLLSPRIKPAIS